MKKQKYITVKSCVTGNSHKSANIPCQDYGIVKTLFDDWHIGVVSDGCGSMAHSHIGSNFVVKSCVEKLEILVDSWIKKGVFPDKKTWRKNALNIVLEIRKELDDYCKENNLDFNQIGCTIIAMLCSQTNLYVFHIGDGRAAYKTGKRWYSCIKPTVGETASSTVFINNSIEIIKQHFESRLIEKNIKAAIVISDGCEDYVYYTYRKNKMGKIRDVNRPFSKLLNHNMNTIQELSKYLSQEEIEDRWANYLENGNGFKDETDDKTFLFIIKN